MFRMYVFFFAFFVCFIIQSLHELRQFKQLVIFGYFHLKLLFKACVRYFSSNFYFHQMIALQNYEKCFLFHLKSSFRSRDIQIFVFSSSPLFFPVSHCLRIWSKKNLKIHNVISCLNKNLITHFFDILRKK